MHTYKRRWLYAIKYDLLRGEHRKSKSALRSAVITAVFLLTTCTLMLYAFPSWLCQMEKKLRDYGKFSEPLIIAITPSYRRPTRFADMTRLANTLHLIPHLHWIVIEDGNNTVPYVEAILRRSTKPFTYIKSPTPDGYPGKGWFQRSVALQYVRNNSARLLENYLSGIVYFVDDDNAYDIRVFTDYVRNVKKLGMWAVGLAGGLPVEFPIAVNGIVIGYHAWKAKNRTFAVDMAGFAVHLDIILSSTAIIGKQCNPGLGPETCLLEDLGLTMEDIEVFGGEGENGQQEILVWHTKTSNVNFEESQVANLPYVFETKAVSRKQYTEEQKTTNMPLLQKSLKRILGATL
ncbi:hypothetical protein V3C99_007398 [Haemonchus contortus]